MHMQSVQTEDMSVEIWFQLQNTSNMVWIPLAKTEFRFHVSFSVQTSGNMSGCDRSGIWGWLCEQGQRERRRERQKNVNVHVIIQVMRKMGLNTWGRFVLS